MKLSVYFTPHGLASQDVQGRPVLVIDVLRATTTIVTALGNGAKAVLPAASGREGRFALEDAYVAGRFARAVLPSRAKGVEIDDAAIAALQLVRRYGEKWKGAVGTSTAARRLKELGLGADVVAATEVDKFDIVPRYAERQVRI